MTDQLVIRGGTVVDGTGGDRFTADLAINDGVITQVGRVGGTGDREIDADGLIVSPGFVDIHTHYDAQAMWDQELASSCWHGVTTVVFGNCGIGFAPVQKAAVPDLISLMEGVEEIPHPILTDGLDFEWTSFGDYLGRLADRRYVLDVGCFVPHSAVRLFAMGERGVDPSTEATEDEARAMAKIVGQALADGGLGFSTSRTKNHQFSDGRLVPTLNATRRELMSISEAIADAGHGVLQLVSDVFSSEGGRDGLEAEFDLVAELTQRARATSLVSLVQANSDPDRWRVVLDLIAAAQARGIDVRAQVAPRAVGVFCGLTCASNPFGSKPSYREIADLPLPERVREMRRPERRAAILAEPLGRHRFTQTLHNSTHLLFDLGDPPNYEPPSNRSVAALAAAAGTSPHEYLYDLLLRDEGRQLVYFPIQNYAGGSLDAVGEMIRQPNTVVGLSDGGAHVGTVCDAGFSTFLMQHWARDRATGCLPLETAIAMQTSRTAATVGLHDRGVLAPGYRADVAVIDFDALAARTPNMAYDFPAGGRRLVQRVDGFRHIIKGGRETFRDGEATGELPGRLVRGPQRVGR